MTPLTPEQIADNVAAVKAHLEGKQKQWLTREFQNTGNWDDCAEDDFNFDCFLYRPAPVPVTRWWNRPEDVPGPVCWIRRNVNSLEEMIVEVQRCGVNLGRDTSMTSWDDLKRFGSEYSLDRKTWQPCTLTEEAK